MKQKFTRFLKGLLWVYISFVLSGCASLLTKKSYILPINSNPKQAEVTIRDKKGMVVWVGLTPCFAEIISPKSKYTIEISKQGYQTRYIPIKSKVKDAFVLNLIPNALLFHSFFHYFPSPSEAENPFYLVYYYFFLATVAIYCIVLDILDIRNMYQLETKPIDITLEKNTPIKTNEF